MIKHLITHTIAAALACTAAFADEQRKDIVKTETKTGNAFAEARADARVSVSTTVTNVNGRPVTIIEDQDENGKQRIRRITYDTGRPKVKNITPKEKQPPKREDPFLRTRPTGGIKNPGGDAK